MAVLLAIAVSLTAGIGHAWAGSTQQYNITGQYISGMKKNTTLVTVFYDKKKTSSEGANLVNLIGNDKKIKLISADKKLKVTVHNGSSAFYWRYYGNGLEVRIKKAGTSKLVFKAGNKKYAVTIKAPKFTFPLKSLKIGDTDYKADLEKEYYDGLYGTTGIWTTTDLSDKQLTIVANKGWKLESDPKNGETLDWAQMTVNATNEKTGMFLAFAVSTGELG